MKKIFKAIGNGLKITWKFLDGKKLIIGSSIVVGAQGLRAFFPNALPSDQVAFIEAFGNYIMYGGLAFKIAKNAKPSASKITEIIKKATGK